MLTLTEDAIEAIEVLLSDPASPEGGGVRITVDQDARETEGNLTVDIVEVPGAKDAVIDERGARLFVDERALEFLDDKVLDADWQGEEVRLAVMPKP